MKSRLFFVLGISVALLVLAVGLALAQEPRPDEQSAASSAASAITAPWTFYDVDEDLDRDYSRHASLAINQNSRCISYYDSVDKDLRMASYVGSGGNCGYSSGSYRWSCNTVDSTDDVGEYSSIDIYDGPDLWDRKIGIAYFDTTNDALKYAYYKCSFLTGCKWYIYTVHDDSTGVYGLYTSIKYDSSGVPHIAYYRPLPGIGALMYAKYVGSGGNCGAGSVAGAWQCDVIDSGTAVGYYASLDLDGAGEPHIAYHAGGAGELKYAKYVGSSIDANCGPGTQWRCDTIDSSGTVGSWASLHVSKGASEDPRIAYYDATNETLKYAHIPSGGANCGPWFLGVQIWRCDTIDSVGADDPMGVSLAVDSSGYSIIAYHDANDLGGRLKVAQPIGRLGVLSGNCGPKVGVLSQWQCDLVGGQYGVINGKYASIALDSSDIATIASNDDSTPAGKLEVAYQEFRIYLPIILRGS